MIREAARLGLLTVEERQITGFRNGPNVLRIVSPEWLARLRLARRGIPLGLPLLEGGFAARPPREGKSMTITPTDVLELGRTRPAGPSEGCRQAAGDLSRSDRSRVLVAGLTGQAIRRRPALGRYDER